MLESAQELGLDASGVTRLALPDSWIIQDSRSKQLAEAGIDAAGIARAIRNAAATESRPVVETNGIALTSPAQTSAVRTSATTSR